VFCVVCTLEECSSNQRLVQEAYVIPDHVDYTVKILLRIRRFRQKHNPIRTRGSFDEKPEKGEKSERNRENRRENGEKKPSLLCTCFRKETKPA